MKIKQTPKLRRRLHSTRCRAREPLRTFRTKQVLVVQVSRRTPSRPSSFRSSGARADALWQATPSPGTAPLARADARGERPHRAKLRHLFRQLPHPGGAGLAMDHEHAGREFTGESQFPHTVLPW